MDILGDFWKKFEDNQKQTQQKSEQQRRIEKQQRKDENKKIIELAKKQAKDKFLYFATEVLGAEPEAFEHLWSVPITDRDVIIAILIDIVPGEKKEVAKESIEEWVDDGIGEAKAVFLTTDELFEKVKMNIGDSLEHKKMLEVIQARLEEKEYNAIIAYDYDKLAKILKDIEAEGIRKGYHPDVLEAEKISRLSEVFIHEICHLNANVLLDSTLDNGVKIINGVSEYDKIEIQNEDDKAENNDKDGAENKGDGTENNDKSETENKDDLEKSAIIGKMGFYNEAAIDTLARIINYYATEKDVNRSLAKIINARRKSPQYKEFDDKMILAMYTVFTHEMIEGMLLGAYGDVPINVLQNKIIEVSGGLQKINHEKQYFEEIETQSDEKIDIDDFADKELLKRIIQYFDKHGKEHYSEEEIRTRKKWLKDLEEAEVDYPEYD